MFCLFVVCLQTVCSLFTSSFRIQILGLGRWTCRRRHRQCWKPLRFRSKPEKKIWNLKTNRKNIFAQSSETRQLHFVCLSVFIVPILYTNWYFICLSIFLYFFVCPNSKLFFCPFHLKTFVIGPSFVVRREDDVDLELLLLLDPQDLLLQLQVLRPVVREHNLFKEKLLTIL